MKHSMPATVQSSCQLSRPAAIAGAAKQRHARLLDLGHVPVRRHAVRVDALGDLNVQVGLLGRAAGARDTCGRWVGGSSVCGLGSCMRAQGRVLRARAKAADERLPHSDKRRAAGGGAPLLASMMMSSFEMSFFSSSGTRGIWTLVG